VKITRYTEPQPHDSKQRWCSVHPQRAKLAVAMMLTDSGYGYPLCEECLAWAEKQQQPRNVGGRPRSPEVPEVTGECPVHGIVDFRIHKIGRRPGGKQRYRARCPQCHSARTGGRKT